MNNHVDGCSLHGVCDTCPFPECRASQRDVLRTRANAIQERHSKIVTMAVQGVHPKVIQRQVGYKDVGDVYKVIRQSKRATA